MNKMYIKSLVVSGKEVEPSILNFVPGINFILGPSNTGKSLVVETIDYAFGNQSNKNNPLKIEENNRGYEEIQLELITSRGTYIKLKRNIYNNNEIEVDSNDIDFPTGLYKLSSPELKELYLKLLGINDRPIIIADKKKQNLKKLTLRGLIHFFIIKQENIAFKNSILITPHTNNIAEIKAILYYLLTNKDAKELEKLKELVKSKSKNENKFEYIEKTLKNMIEEKKLIEESNNQLLKKISSKEKQIKGLINPGNLSETLDKIIENEINKIKTSMNKFLEENNLLTKEIAELENELSENSILKRTMDRLKSQYEADLSRFNFVIDGVIELDKLEENINCPICNSSINRKIEINEEFCTGTLEEYNDLQLHIRELEKTQMDLDDKISKIKIAIKSKKELKANNENTIKKEFEPILQEFQEFHEIHLQIEKLDVQLRQMDKLISEFESELEAKKELSIQLAEVKKNVESIEYFFEGKTLEEYNKRLAQTLKKCKFGNLSDIKLNESTLDVEIKGILKSVSMGGGYMSVINYLVALTMFNFIIENGGKTLGFLIADSILTQLSESEGLENENTIKTSFLNYILKEIHQGQLIIVEQTERMPFIPNNDGEKVKVIKFTGDKNRGREGFLIDDINNRKEKIL